MRTTEEDLEEESGRGDREDWFKKDALTQVERRSASNCRRNGVNPDVSTKGKT